jgi:hypothetical protein
LTVRGRAPRTCGIVFDAVGPDGSAVLTEGCVAS